MHDEVPETSGRRSWFDPPMTDPMPSAAHIRHDYDEAAPGKMLPASDLPGELVHLDTALAGLHKELDQLGDRLSPILKAEGPTAPDVAAAAERRVASGLADQVDSLRISVDRAHGRLRALRQRLDLPDPEMF